MKKAFFTLALLVQVGFAMATEKTKNVAQVRHENVKMYQQAGTASKLLKSLTTADRVEILRRLNNQWTIVMVDGEAGYVLHSELVKPTAYQTLAAASAKR
ncbi:SH3 domain-containing protein [Adhaeribacter rhizoryzae]|uniref:SH3 domain-containing protein n=1 Tax=Adhaeribacter rhizoryzae TaxID=2607907 RepID=A0A5M6DBZ6_9BACT|nr:SH3 domain-containing protein [Adhaeribacter rhizoryzae]KAA5545071.1 SH3 domain-containing protein [Adhaeribacter rhizoryzae]